MNKRLWFAVAIGLVLIIGSGAYYWTMNKPHRDYSSEESSTIITANELYEEYFEDESLANQKYLDQMIVVEGTITDINSQFVILDDHIVCTMEKGEGEKIIQLGQGKQVKLKGRCVSWDDLFEEVRMDHVFVE